MARKPRELKPNYCYHIPTTGETRVAKSLGEWLFAIGDEEWKGKKVVAWTDEFTLGQAESNREYGGT